MLRAPCFFICVLGAATLRRSRPSSSFGWPTSPTASCHNQCLGADLSRRRRLLLSVPGSALSLSARRTPAEDKNGLEFGIKFAPGI